MKYVFIMVVAGSIVCFAHPISDIPELEETWTANQYVFPLVYDVPDSLIPEGVTDLIITALPAGELALTVYLIGNGTDVTDVLASGPYQGECNFAKSFASWDPERSVIELYFQMPYCARYSGAVYEWTGSDLVPIEWLSGDPSMDALENIDSLLAIGEIEKAGIELGDMFYPGSYYYPGEMTIKFLRSTHEHALAEYRAGNPEGAVQLFLEAEDAMRYQLITYPWYSAFEDSSDFYESSLQPYTTIGEFTMIANDYGFFLEQSFMYEEAVDVLYGVLALDPQRMVAYLNLGDALWGLHEYHNAVSEYLTYMQMMEDVNLKEDIPERVNQRVLNYIGPL